MSMHARPESKAASAVVWSPATKRGQTSSRLARGTGGDQAGQEAGRVAARFSHDFSKLRIHADAPAGAPAREGTAHAFTVDDDSGAAAGRAEESQQVIEPAADEAQALSTHIKIDQLNVITSATGAFSGFPTLNEADLNKPGPFNNTTTTGSCANVHQMQFHLAKGDPKEVKLIRKVVRVSSAAGKTSSKGEKDKPAGDGPSPETVIRPKDSPNVVVVDSPGFYGTGDFKKSKGAFPVSYDADFDLFATDLVEPTLLAKLQYSVKIFKKAPDDTSPVNEITVKSKKLF